MPHQEDEGEKKHFLAGVVEQEKRLGIQVTYQAVRDVRIFVEAARAWIWNRENIQSDNARWNEFNLALEMNW